VNKVFFSAPLFRLVYCPSCFEFVDTLPNFYRDIRKIIQCSNCSYNGEMVSISEVIILKRQKKLDDLLGDSN
jgi:hypothetical protein